MATEVTAIGDDISQSVIDGELKKCSELENLVDDLHGEISDLLAHQKIYKRR